MKKVVAIATLSAFAVSACTTTQKVTVEQPGDRAMSCEELKREHSKIDAVLADADRDKGVNGANVAAVLFFWPAAVRNYMDADHAEELARNRQSHLMSIYGDKNCDAQA